MIDTTLLLLFFYRFSARSFPLHLEGADIYSYFDEKGSVVFKVLLQFYYYYFIILLLANRKKYPKVQLIEFYQLAFVFFKYIYRKSCRTMLIIFRLFFLFSFLPDFHLILFSW